MLSSVCQFQVSQLRPATLVRRKATTCSSAKNAVKPVQSGEIKSSNEAASTPTPSAKINVIQPISQWPTGVPPAMGGHFMTSGDVAPISTSKGPGIDIHPLVFTYSSANTPTDVAIFEDRGAAASGLADLLSHAAAEAVAARGAFVVALSGGSLINTFATALQQLAGAADLSKWWVVYVDERNVAHSSADSNHGAAQQAALGGSAIPAAQVLAIKEGLPVGQAAIEYAGQLLDLPAEVLPRTADDLPSIDLVLLGVGPDGHVASLFPNTTTLADKSGAWVLPVSNSPKPPPQRITLSLPVLNAAKHVAVVALGPGKAEVVQRALEVQALPGSLPVQLVRPSAGQLTWVLDKAAAANLTQEWWVPEGGKKSAWRFPRSEPPQ